MRFATMLAAACALLMGGQAGAAVTVNLNFGKVVADNYFTSIVHLTGLNVADVVVANASAGQETFYYWDTNIGVPGGWYINGNESWNATCGTTADDRRCKSSFLGIAPQTGAIIRASVDLFVRDSKIVLVWSRALTQGRGCISIPDEDRVRGENCAFGFQHSPGYNDTQLSFTIAGPNEKTFGYTVETLIGAAVPEPATWALMILGLGLTGAAVRRRHATGTTALLSAHALQP
jgi:hypothetical protein